ncbi:hypothetical protein KPH14_002575 [Odynerus spinipes]|uniref:Uncharacterized protein n=1 Tax=Odynerus spinipes TaxID=1348599 RepID=A0AAD9R8K7_9HYME|nr:hypothetical protein KPH14_002575 [Odynerus spinipes]
MGNVSATSAPPPPPPPPSAPVLLPQLGKTDPSTGDTTIAPTSERLENPGTIEDLHKKCKDVLPVNFEGAKLMLNKGLSNHFQISHTINMSSVSPSGYRFGATYVGTKQICPTEAYPVLFGDIDPTGNLNANIIHQFGQKLRAKVAAQVLRSNPDILNGSGVLVAHYLRSITPSIALGGEVAYQRGPGLPGGKIVVVSAAGRYTNGESTISCSLGPAGCHVCFHQKASQNLQIGVELEINARLQESTGTIAYQVDLPKADLLFRGSVDTNWAVGAVLEKKLQPLPFSFALSGMLNHSKQQFRLGCGLIIG